MPEEQMEKAKEQPREADEPGKVQAVVERLKAIFARDKLFQDTFIRQHMNAEMEIPLCILPGHPELVKLGAGANVATLLEACRRFDRVVLDEDQMLVSPNLKPRRNTLILHDLPEGVTEEELRQLFEGSPAGKSLISVKPDVNRTAFVTFDTDDDAQRSALWLRSQKLHGDSVKCAIKSEQLHRGFFAPTTPPPVPINAKDAMFAMSGHQAQMMMWSPGMWAQTDPSLDPQWTAEDSTGQWSMGESAEGWVPVADGDLGGKPKGKSKGFKGKDNGKDNDKGKGKRAGSFSSFEQSQMQMGATGVRPPMHEDAALGHPPDDDLGECPGYMHEFRKYSREQIIEICSGMDEVAKPESFCRLEAQDENIALFLQSPCKDWAPLPVPQPPFHDRRATGNDDFAGEGGADGGKGWGGHGASRKGGDKGSWPRRSVELEGDWHREWDESAEWAWDAWWADDQAGARWKPRSKPRGQWGDWGGDWHSGEQRWVQKHRPGEEEDEEQQTDTWLAEGRGQRGSWVEKAKGGSQKWQAKGRAEGENSTEAGQEFAEASVGDGVTAAAPDGAAPAEAEVAAAPDGAASAEAEVAAAPDGAAPGAAAPPVAVNVDSAAPGGGDDRPAAGEVMSWADKVRRGSPKSAPAAAPAK